MRAPEYLERLLAPVVAALAPQQGIKALSLGGSTQAGLADDDSDLDVHVWWFPPLVPPDERAAVLAPLVDPGSLRVEIHSWGLEDHFTVDGMPVELIYFRLDELQEQVERAYTEGLDSEAFTTAFLYTLAHARPLHDPTGALWAIRDRLNHAFPEATFRVLMERRSPLLQVTVNQIRKAQQRQDLLSVQQKRASFQTIFFNLLFTLNRRYHPGEKRLLIHSQSCPLRPPSHEERWLASGRMAADDPELPALLEGLALDLLHLIGEQPDIHLRHEVW